MSTLVVCTVNSSKLQHFHIRACYANLGIKDAGACTLPWLPQCGPEQLFISLVCRELPLTFFLFSPLPERFCPSSEIFACSLPSLLLRRRVMDVWPNRDGTCSFHVFRDTVLDLIFFKFLFYIFKLLPPKKILKTYSS